MGCPSPKQPPTNSQGIEFELEPHGYSGEVIPVNGTVSYRCKGGKKFKANLSQVEVSASCVLGEDWSEPDDWGTCVETIRCNAPPSKPDSGSNLITSYGARFGPVCEELQEGSGNLKELGRELDESGNCPKVRTRITGTEGVTEWTISVVGQTKNSNHGVNEIFLRVEMTSPPLQFMGDPGNPLVTVTPTNNSNIFGVHLDVTGSKDDGTTKKFKVIALPDTRYTTLCIDEMVCSKCDSGAATCKSFFHASETDKLATDNFVKTSQSHNVNRYNFGATAEQECGAGRKFHYPNGTQVERVQIRCGWDKGWSPRSVDMPQCGCK